MIRGAFVRLDSRLYSRVGFERIEKLNASDEPLPDPARLDLATIAFNNPMVISEQIRLLRKNLQDPFEYTVADQSPDPELAARIRRVCAEAEVGYLMLPRGRLRLDPSMSHGRALNWVLANYLRPRRAHYVGLLDHDVFPIRPTAVIPRLSHAPVWGVEQRRGRRWYLWPGLNFFDARRIPLELLDFLPAPGFDTGGRNYETVYSKLDPDDLDAPSTGRRRLRDGDEAIQSDHYSLIGDWLHTFNASHWMPVTPRDHLVAELLRRY